MLLTYNTGRKYEALCDVIWQIDNIRRTVGYFMISHSGHTATSAPSERIFSVAGLTVNARRSSLAPSSMDKIIFVHENALINE